MMFGGKDGWVLGMVWGGGVRCSGNGEVLNCVRIWLEYFAQVNLEYGGRLRAVSMWECYGWLYPQECDYPSESSKGIAKLSWDIQYVLPRSLYSFTAKMDAFSATGTG